MNFFENLFFIYSERNQKSLIEFLLDFSNPKIIAENARS